MRAFKWPVAVEGYTWAAEDGTWLSADELHPDEEKFGEYPDVHLEPVRYSFQEYEPLQETGLFRTFADTSPTPAGILSFAGKYGNLGAELKELDEPLEQPDFESPEEEEEWRRDLERHLRLFDSISFWRRAITEMRQCVRDWERALQGKGKDRDIEKVLRTLNCKLTRDRLQLAFVKDRRPSGFAMQIVPSYLLSALWLQLGQTITENKRLRSCASCGKWFEVAPSKHRKSCLYCQAACRSRAYRERKQQALRMAGTGKTAKQIADTLESTVDTVEGWLSQREE